MQALRTRAACAARRARPTRPRTSRSYASESHGHDEHHHAAPQVEEGLGTAFYIFAGALPASIIAYQLSRPGKDGEPSSVSRWLSNNFDYFNTWEERNVVRTQMIEQAAHDKHLFLNAGRSPHVELTTPELLFQTGSPYNVPAGHLINLDHVAEHYRKQAADEEERKLKNLAEKQRLKEAKQQQERSPPS